MFLYYLFYHPRDAIGKLVSVLLMVLCFGSYATYAVADTQGSTSPADGLNNPSSVSVGDINGDGKPDLAVANSGYSTIYSLLGNGAGIFGNGGISP